MWATIYCALLAGVSLRKLYSSILRMIRAVGFVHLKNLIRFSFNIPRNDIASGVQPRFNDNKRVQDRVNRFE